MKILSLNTFSVQSPIGGAERTMDAMLRALQSRGHDVSVIGTAAEAGLTHQTVDGLSVWHAGIRNLYWPQPEIGRAVWQRQVWHLRDIYNFAMKRQLQQVLDITIPDVVILHNLTGWSISAVNAVHGRKIPIVQILHDHYNICPNVMMFRNGRNCIKQCGECRLMRAPHRAITNKIDAVVGVSQYILDRHLAHGAYSQVPVKRVIRNVRSAVSLGLEKAPALRAKALAVRGDVTIRFGFIGTVAPYKGVAHLLEAFMALNDPKAELWVAGTGLPDYLAMLREKHPSPRIKFLGRMVPLDFFTAIDVTVVPSLWQENYPGVVSESFAFGVPVIGSRRGGIPEMGLGQGAGIIFEPDEPGGLTAALRLCAKDGAALARMSNLALQMSGRFLDIEKWADQYEEVIRLASENVSTER